MTAIPSVIVYVESNGEAGSESPGGSGELIRGQLEHFANAEQKQTVHEW